VLGQSRNKKIIVRMLGGLGNQLFCYAAARRLALVNDAELVIDDETGFSRDFAYRRRYALDVFSFRARKATNAEKLKPFDRVRRQLLRYGSSKIEFARRRYLVEELDDFDRRLLDRQVLGTLYMEGYWQSELYFKDVAEKIREDLVIKPPSDQLNVGMRDSIQKSNSVGIHLRWFDKDGSVGENNVVNDYYSNAISAIQSAIPDPHFFVFSDDPAAAARRLDILPQNTTFIGHNTTDGMAFADLWLMSQCKHNIIANSTFSWWAAWLGERSDKMIIAPNPTKMARASAWATEGLLPNRWLQI
jgi:hypothetical protein